MSSSDGQMTQQQQQEINDSIKSAVQPYLGLIKSNVTPNSLSKIAVTPPSAYEAEYLGNNFKTTISPSGTDLCFLVNLSNSQVMLQMDVNLTLSDPQNGLAMFLLDATTLDVGGMLTFISSSNSKTVQPIGPNQMILFGLHSALGPNDIANVDITSVNSPTTSINPTKNPQSLEQHASNLRKLVIGGGIIIILLAVVSFFMFNKKSKTGFRRRRLF